MKSWITAIIAVAIIALIFFFIGKCSSKDEPVSNPDNSREIELQLQNDSLVRHIEQISLINDSLAKERQKIKTQIVYRERLIDENIAKDSSNSISEFRQSLTENQELPDNTLYPTYREFGLSAKIMSKVPKLGIIINIQDSIIFNKDLIITDKDYIISGYKETVDLKNESIEYWQELYRDEASFWNSKELWFGLGVVGTVAIVIATGIIK